MPADRLRLYKLLAKYSVHVIFLSGDVHFGEIGYRYVH
jgi:phosphodiesterase/alkaline phosphatase D-like protein